MELIIVALLFLVAACSEDYEQAMHDNGGANGTTD